MLPIRLPRLDGGGTSSGPSLRYLARRIIQAMAEQATANFILGERSVPGRFLVLRLAEDEDDRAEQEQQVAESREAIEREVRREARARDFRLRATLDVEVRMLAPADLEAGEAAALLRPLVDEEELSGCLTRLRAERELILTRRLHSLSIDSRPRAAAVYVDDRQIDRTTPCRLDDLPAGTHTITLSLPGHLLHEGTVEIHEDGRAPRQRYFAELQPEPPMRVLEVVTFPGQASLTLGRERGESPARFRLPIGRHALAVSRDTYAPQSLEVDLPPGPEETPERVQIRLEYVGEDRDIPVGKLVIYKPLVGQAFQPATGTHPGPAAGQAFQPAAGTHPGPAVGQAGNRATGSHPDSTVFGTRSDPHTSGMQAGKPAPRDLRPLDRPEDTISAFFGDVGAETETWPPVPRPLTPDPQPSTLHPPPEVIGERPLHKGVLVIGREDRRSEIVPDVKLFDPGNTVSRGCHAWIHIYTDPGTGAEYNTFVIHNNSPAGILVDGQLVMESLALGDIAEIQIGVFRMQVRKETPEPSVQF